jgi:hypothetical protein
MKFIQTWLILCAAVLFAWQSTAVSNEQIKITIASWAFEEKQAENLEFNLSLTNDGLAVQATADVLNFAEPIGQINDVSLSCDELQLNSKQYSCLKGSLAFTHAKLARQKIQFLIQAKPETTNYIVTVKGLNLADTDISLQAELENDNWHVLLDMPKASLKNVIAVLSPYLAEKHVETLTSWSYESNLAIKTELHGKKKQLQHANVNLVASALNLSDKEGLFVTENTAVLLDLDLKQINHDWHWQADVTLDKGQAYGEPVFLDFSESPFSFTGHGVWQNDKKNMLINQAKITQQDIVDLTFELESNFEQLKNLNVTVNKTDVQKLYPIWIQPFLVDSAVANLELSGFSSVHFEMQEGNYQFEMNLDNVFIDDEEGMFGIYDLNGNIAWTNLNMPLASQLSWQGAYVYAIQLGASEIIAETKLSRLDLQQTWVLPILDGELQLNGFSLHQDDNDKTQWTFNGLLTPISMEALSSALEWPTLHGKLSGVIPKVNYVEQNIHVDGALMVKLFGGTTVIRDLQLEQPFGSLPQLYANVDMNSLDLETLTQTFDFGKITGKLDGRVNNLRLSDWQPVQFDAQFYTPENDKSRRRISQKAVENLSQIGGGASGVLSRGFLRFFKDFSYQRLGLNCKLTNDICEMSGVSEAEQGYYIVKGGGLPPRINVVGYTHRVDWPDLIERLKSVSQSSGPVIQ